MNTLDQWKTEAKELYDNYRQDSEAYLTNLEVKLIKEQLALINLVKKKDELIRDIQKHFKGDHKEFCNFILLPTEPDLWCNCGKKWIDETLALTDQLK